MVTPHLGARIDAVNGRTLARIRPPPRRHLRISDLTRETILHGMERAAMEPGGTSYSVFEASRSRSRARPAPRSEARGRGPVVVRGTAPAGEPRIIVVATVEGGGFGVEAAAPSWRASSSTRPGSRRVMEALKDLAFAPRRATFAERLGLPYIDP